MVIFFGSRKGGTGKSTFALNMAIMRALTGKRVLLVDTDPQGSGQGWTETRRKKHIDPLVTCVIGKGEGIADTIRALQGGFDDIVVDTKGDNSLELRLGLTAADKVITPLEPSQFDIETLVFMERLVGDIRVVNPKLVALLIANKASTHPKDREVPEFRRHVEKTCKHYRMLDGAIGTRQIYKVCAKRAQAVSELSGINGYDRAIIEMQQLAAEVWK